MYVVPPKRPNLGVVCLASDTGDASLTWDYVHKYVGISLRRDIQVPKEPMRDASGRSGCKSRWGSMPNSKRIAWS